MFANRLAPWWRNWVRRSTKCVPARRRKERLGRLRLEALEDRCLPAQTIFVNPVSLTAPVAAGLYSGPVETFSVLLPGNVPGDFTAVINWGDNTPATLGTVVLGPPPTTTQFEVLGSHVYHEGNYLPTVTITDNFDPSAGRPTLPFVAGPAPASWNSNLPTMPLGLDGVATVTGHDGRIYVLGGFDSSFKAVNTVEVFNPATGAWTSVARMPTARGNLAAAVGPDGRIYAIGGQGIGGQFNTVEVYDPVSNSWSTAASMLTARSDLAAAVGPDGRIYALGGISSTGTDLATVEVYDTASNTWTTLFNMHTGRADLAAVSVNGHIYAIGGINSNVALNTLEAYDTSINLWFPVSSMPTARDGLAAVLGPDSRIYALGGLGLNTVEAYDPDADTWTPVAGMNSPRFSLGAALGSDGRIYAIGGQKGGIFLNTMEALSFQGVHVVHGSLTAGPVSVTLTQGKSFAGAVTSFTTNNTLEQAGNFTASINWGDGTATSPGTVSGGMGQFTVSGTHTYAGGVGNYPIHVTITDSVGDQVVASGTLASTSAPSMPTVRYLLATTTGLNGRIYAIGGFGGQNAVEAFNPASNTWTSLAPLPTGRYELAAVTSLDGRIYAIGGTNGAAVNAMEVYNPTTNTWATLPPIPTARAWPAAAVGADGRIYVIGGFDSSNTALGTVEAYDPATNTWSTLAGLPTARGGMGAVTGPDGLIYVVGGATTSFATNLSTVEVYDPVTNAWTTAASMPTARSGLAATLGADGRIYALGGFNGGYLSTVEVYDPVANSWTAAANLPTARYGAGAALGRDGRIYVAGGYNGTSGVNSVTALQSSAVTVTDLPVSVAGVAAAAATGIPFSGNLFTMTDADTTAVASDYSVTLNWGDGTSPTPVSAASGGITGSSGSFSVNGTHTYSRFGSYTVTLEGTDAEGQTFTGTTTVNVFPPVQQPLQPLSATASDSSVYKLSKTGILTRTPASITFDFDHHTDRFLVTGTTVYDLENNGHLIRFQNGKPVPRTLLDLDVVAFAVESSGAVDILEADGTLRQFNNNKLTLTPLYTNVESLLTTQGGPVMLDRNGNLRAGAALGNLLGTNVESIGVDGTTPEVFGIRTDGTLMRFQTAGGAPLQLATGVFASLRVPLNSGPSGNLLALRMDGTLELVSEASGSASIVSVGIKSYGLAADGSYYYLTTSGTLVHAFTQLATRINSFALAADGSVYTLSSTGVVVKRTGTTVTTLVGSGARSIAVTDPGDPEVLLTNGTLETWNEGNFVITSDTNLQAFVQAANNRYDLHTGGSLQSFSADGQATVATGINAIVPSLDGFTLQARGAGGATSTVNGVAANLVDNTDSVLFRQETSGKLWELASGFWTTLDTAAQSVALDTTGVLYELQTNGTLRSLIGGVFSTLDSGVKSMALAADNSLVYLQTSGALWDFGPTDWSLLDSNVLSYSLAGNLVSANESGGTSRQFMV
jgi:N-acetylneuraminic acid mutarotase